jgi:hypothetical protein
MDSIEIPVEIYEDLLRTAERVAVLERIVEENEYIPVNEIRAILDFKPKRFKKETE